MLSNLEKNQNALSSCSEPLIHTIKLPVTAAGAAAIAKVPTRFFRIMRNIGNV